MGQSLEWLTELQSILRDYKAIKPNSSAARDNNGYVLNDYVLNDYVNVLRTFSNAVVDNPPVQFGFFWYNVGAVMYV